MEYRETFSIKGDPARSLEIAESVFANNAFRIDRPTDRELLAKGPGMKSTNQNPLLGVTQARITVRGTSLEVEADLGGVRFMRNFLYIFPPALILFIHGTFLIAGMEAKRFLWVDVVFIAVWVVLAPFLGRLIRNRTLKALETLIHNMTSLTER